MKTEKSNEFKRALNALLKCNRVIRENHDEQLLLDRLCRVIVEDVGYRLAWVGYKEADEQMHVSPAASSGFNEGYVEKVAIVWSETQRGLGPTGSAIRTGKPVICQNITTDERLKPWKEDALKRGYESSIALPIIIEDSVIGSLTIYAAQPNAFDPDEVELLQELTDSLSFGILHIRQNKSLIESEERYRTIFNGIIMPVLIIHPNTLEMKDANEQACLFYGYAKDELLKKRLPDIHTLPEERLKEIASEIIDKKRHFLTTRHRTSSGDIKDIDVYTRSVNIQGKDYICSTIHDITELKRLEKDADLSNEILNNVSDGVSLIRTSDGIIVYANPEMEKMARYEKGELRGKHISIINDPTDIDPMETAHRIMKELNKHGSWQGDILNIRSDGTTFRCYARVSTFEHSKFGTVWVTIHTDISESLKKEERYKTILSTSIDGFLVLDMEGKIIQANRAYSKMSGYSAEDLLQMKIRDVEFIETAEQINRRIS